MESLNFKYGPIWGVRISFCPGMCFPERKVALYKLSFHGRATHCSSPGDIMYATCEIYYIFRSCISHERVFIVSLQENPYATLTMSLAQTNFCRKNGFDPQSPLCAHIILSGAVTKVSGPHGESGPEGAIHRQWKKSPFGSTVQWLRAGAVGARNVVLGDSEFHQLLFSRRPGRYSPGK